MTANPYRVKALWKTYAQMVLPQGVSQTQFIETRRAFYAGCECLLRCIMRDLTPGTEENEEDLQLMQHIEDEILEFCEDLKTGKA